MEPFLSYKMGFRIVQTSVIQASMVGCSWWGSWVVRGVVVRGSMQMLVEWILETKRFQKFITFLRGDFFLIIIGKRFNFSSYSFYIQFIQIVRRFFDRHVVIIWVVYSTTFAAKFMDILTLQLSLEKKAAFPL
jgi:hypothetical protein